MENVNIECAVEGILFAAGEPVKAAKLASVLEVSIEEINKAVDSLKKTYDSKLRGLKIIDIDEGYQLCSRPEYYAYIQDILGEQRRQALSNAAMEALAIIAYKQPVTKGQVEFIRGVNSDGAVNRLAERGLVEECGRLDAPGRPILFRTTQNFLRCFGLKTPQDLPAIDFSKLGNEYEQLEIAEISEDEGAVVEENSSPSDDISINSETE